VWSLSVLDNALDRKYNIQNFTTFERDIHFMFLLQVGLALDVGTVWENCIVVQDLLLNLTTERHRFSKEALFVERSLV
jgi:hypothetical protein